MPESKFTQKAYLESLESIINDSPVGYLSTSKDGTIISINNTLLNDLEYQREEVVGKKSFQDLMSVGGKIFYETHYLPLLIHQKKVKELSFDIVSKSGKRLPVLVNTITSKDLEGSLIYRSTIFDISDRKQYEEQLFREKKKAEQLAKELETTNQELKSFAYALSHDIKSPLSNISGVAKLLLNDQLEIKGEEGAKFLSIIDNSASQLISIVDGILKYYTMRDIESKNREEIHLKELVHNIFLVADPESKVKFNFNLGVDSILHYREPLRMVLLNIITNAIKYNDKQEAVISISSSIENDHFVISVEDNGIGIREEDYQKMFIPLKTLNVGNEFAKKGTGLGLFYVKNLVERMGGEISVSSEIHKGSIFTLKLKRA